MLRVRTRESSDSCTVYGLVFLTFVMDLSQSHLYAWFVSSEGSNQERISSCNKEEKIQWWTVISHEWTVNKT